MVRVLVVAVGGVMIAWWLIIETPGCPCPGQRPARVQIDSHVNICSRECMQNTYTHIHEIMIVVVTSLTSHVRTLAHTSCGNYL